MACVLFEIWLVVLFAFALDGLVSFRMPLSFSCSRQQQQALSGRVGRKAEKMAGTLRRTSTKQVPLEVDTLEFVASRVRAMAPSLVQGLREKGYFMADEVLSSAMCSTLRNEAVKLYNDGSFTLSQSARWDPISKSLVTYSKHNVYSTELKGGESYYDAPQLHEYVFALIKTVVPILSEAFPGTHLSPTHHATKLAVCTGDGSRYDKHYDNAGLDDVRKVTFLYYMNKNWRDECAGQFRVYNNDGSTTDIEPLADRMLVFWSDRMVHSVEASFAPRGEEDHRYALTVWLTTTDVAFIERNDAMVKLHFG